MGLRLRMPLRPEQAYPSSSKESLLKYTRCGYQWEAVIGSRNQGFGVLSVLTSENYIAEYVTKKEKSARQQMIIQK